MKVNITHSVSLEAMREKVSDIGIEAVDCLPSHLTMLTEALSLFKRRQITTQSFLAVLDSFRKALATIDNSLAEVEQLSQGIQSVDEAVEKAINSPPQATTPSSSFQSDNQQTHEDIKTKLQELKERVEQ